MTAKRNGGERWRDFVSLKARFQRSVHIERDARQHDWLEGYVLSPAPREVLHRIAAGAQGRARAWSLTGPYGTGKSSLVLFASHALGVPGPAAERAAHAVEESDRELAGVVRGAQGLVAVRVTGERRRLDAILLDALKRAVDEFFTGPGAKPAFYEELDGARARAAEGERVSTSKVVRLFEAVAKKIATSNRRGRGLLVVLDEAGKVLEHAAQQPAEGDIQLLQELAEAAARSGDTPLVLIVVLHQGFEQYASRLSAAQRSEWAKVQGRFEDLPFQEAQDAIVQLIGHALKADGLPRAAADRVAVLAGETVKLMPRLPGARAAALRDALTTSAPLHPLTALLLGPIFRSGFAQNERSLFAFLMSSEPCGFQEFLDRPIAAADGGGLYAPDRLYDYLRATTGFRSQGPAGRQWTHAETVLGRLPADATELDAKIIRTIAVIAGAGDASGLRASEETLRVALSGPGVPPGDLKRRLEWLRQRSLLVFRKYRDAYQLWDGSDLDLDALIRTGAAQSVAAGGTVRRLARIAPPRPLIPRRHAMQTGNLRYFEVRYADEMTFDAGLERSSVADGTLYIAVATDDRAEADLRARLGQPLFWARTGGASHDPPVVVAVPRSAARLRQLAADLAAMEWVQTNTAELRDDVTARRELAGRIAGTEALLRDEIAAVYGGTKSDWYAANRRLKVDTARDVSKQLSAVLNEAYDKAPWVHNEIINRNDLSSAGAAARRDLLEAMIERGAVPRLGIEGFPPEYAIFASVLEAHELFVAGRSGPRFRPPTRDEHGSFKPAWDEVLGLLDGAERNRVALTTISEHLRRPPFGMRDGVSSILLVTILLERQNELALYEEGTFTPALTTAVAERMMRSPGRFELQRVRVTGTRAAILRRLAPDATANVGLVPVARQLVRIATSLPDYSRNTKRISPTAVNVREALLRAKEPGPLLFRLLPEACGVTSVSPDGPADEALSTAFVDRLKAALRELGAAFPGLLQHVAASLGVAFGAPVEVRGLRAVIGPRARRILDAPMDAALKPFVLRLADAELDDDSWIVSVATLLGGKPPETWHDQDVDLADMKMAALRKSFGTVEALHLALLKEPIADDGYLMRVAIAEPGKPEAERVAAAQPADVPAVRATADTIRRAMAAAAPVSRDVALVALALYARELIGEASGAPSALVTAATKELPS